MYFFSLTLICICLSHTHFLLLPRSLVHPHQAQTHTVLRVLLFKFAHDLRETERVASCHSKNKQQVIKQQKKKRENALHRWRVHPPWDEWPSVPVHHLGHHSQPNSSLPLAELQTRTGVEGWRQSALNESVQEWDLFIVVW